MPKVNSRRIGRPVAEDSEALDRHILRTATRLFINQGYAATSMEQVAAAAGAGKQTIYRRYASKEELFAAVLKEMVDAVLKISSAPQREASDPLAALRESMWAAMELGSQSHPLALYRILIAEAPRFPLLIDRVAKALIEPTDEMLSRLIVAARESGQLRSDYSVADMLHALSGMITGRYVEDRLLGRKGLSGETERRAFFDAAWALFLEGAARAGFPRLAFRGGGLGST